MTPRWEALDARARGLATHLLGRHELDALAQAADLPALATALRNHGFPLEEDEAAPGAPGAPAALELAVRRLGAVRLRVLSRWSGAGAGLLTVVFEDEDRRSLRALLRGAVQGVPAEARLAGLVPTRALPERALRELARQDRPGTIAALLTAWRNPYGSALFAVVSAAHPDLFQFELLLNRTFAARAGRAARGGGLLSDYVRETIDLENAYTALVLSAEGRDVRPPQAFLAGGERLPIAAFEMALAAGRVPEAGRRLAASFAGTPIAAALERHGGDPVALEAAVLQARIGQLVRTIREDPLGPAPVLAYALRLRAEAVDLRRIIWGVALEAPRALLARELVTV